MPFWILTTHVRFIMLCLVTLSFFPSKDLLLDVLFRSHDSDQRHIPMNLWLAAIFVWSECPPTFESVKNHSLLVIHDIPSTKDTCVPNIKNSFSWHWWFRSMHNDDLRLQILQLNDHLLLTSSIVTPFCFSPGEHFMKHLVCDFHQQICSQPIRCKDCSSL